jgi:hypothetical protein
MAALFERPLGVRGRHASHTFNSDAESVSSAGFFKYAAGSACFVLVGKDDSDNTTFLQKGAGTVVDHAVAFAERGELLVL